MDFNDTTRIKLGILVIASFLIFSNLRFLERALTLGRTSLGNDEITLYEKRLVNLIKVLPRHGFVAYLDDIQGVHNQAFKEYYLTQYAVIPVILVNPKFLRADPEVLLQKNKLIVANFHVPTIDPKISAHRDFVLLRDFGNGVKLYNTGTQ